MIFLCAAASGGGGTQLQVQSPVIHNIELSAGTRAGEAGREQGRRCGGLELETKVHPKVCNHEEGPY